MRISVNRKLNVAYVHFQDQPAPLETKRLSGDLFMDVGLDGIVYGPERVNASEHLRRASPSRTPSSASDLVLSAKALPPGNRSLLVVPHAGVVPRARRDRN